MRKYIKELVENKNVLILGFGREGRSSYALISNVGGYSHLDIADMNDIKDGFLPSTRVISGQNYLNVIDDYDIVLKSPGIVLPKDISEYKAMITCEIDLFLKVYGKQTLGITGTKGKSTTTTLLYHTLKTAGRSVILAGNIGIPVFDIIDEITSDTLMVVELSCHQLEFNHYAPHIAALLNLHEDHLDHYGTFDKYCNAKRHIYENQTAEDYIFILEEFAPSNDSIPGIKHFVQASDLPFTTWEEVGPNVRLKGNHNLINAAFAYDMAKLCDVSDEDFISALQTYETLPHRLQKVAEINGVEYYDDSISTTVEAAISAMEAIQNCGVILLGGMDRGIDYEALVAYLKDSMVPEIVFMYDSGKRVLDMLSEVASPDRLSHVHYIPELKEACQFAKDNVKAGQAVVLSPAAASYGFFKNFEERGDKFKEYILTL